MTNDYLSVVKTINRETGKLNEGGWLKEVSKGFCELVTSELRPEEWEQTMLLKSRKKTIQTPRTAMSKPLQKERGWVSEDNKEAGR